MDKEVEAEAEVEGEGEVEEITLLFTTESKSTGKLAPFLIKDLRLSCKVSEGEEERGGGEGGEGGDCFMRNVNHKLRRGAIKKSPR